MYGCVYKYKYIYIYIYTCMYIYIYIYIRPAGGAIRGSMGRAPTGFIRAPVAEPLMSVLCPTNS